MQKYKIYVNKQNIMVNLYEKRQRNPRALGMGVCQYPLTQYFVGS